MLFIFNWLLWFGRLEVIWIAGLWHKISLCKQQRIFVKIKFILFEQSET